MVHFNYEKLLPTTIFKINNNQPVGIYGDGKNERDWIYVIDHAIAIHKYFLKGKIGETYNVGGEKSLSNLHLLILYIKHLRKLWKKIKKIIFIKDRPGHDKKYLINANKMKKLAGKKYKIFLGLKETIKWYLKRENLNYFKTKKYNFSRLG